MTILHLVYIHGFQGSEANFQRFPNDLQQWICANLPPNSPLEIKSSIYPRYKAEKPLIHATHNFLEWLSLQPPGLVVLFGHSMGGMLAAEAAFGADLLSDKLSKHKVIGVIGLDSPYLGVHPHIAKSGISTFVFGSDKKKSHSATKPPDPKVEHSEDSDDSIEGKGKGKPEERDARLNPDVHVVDQKVTDDWEEVKKSWGVSKHLKPLTHTQTSRSGTVTDGSLSDRLMSASTTLFHKLNISGGLEALHVPHLPPPADPSTLIDSDTLAPPAPIENFLETFQFAAALLDPIGLHERYEKLVKWHNGRWVNYFTECHAGPTPSTPQEGSHEGGSHKVVERPRHFIILPTGFGLRSLVKGAEKWEKVVVVNAETEIHGHCLMLRRKNLVDYDAFLALVGNRTLEWANEDVGKYPLLSTPQTAAPSS